jgi:hypothetical protein
MTEQRTISERDVRMLGLPQINAGLVMSAGFAQGYRREALEVLLADAGEDPEARAAVIQACRLHPDARWWLLHKRAWGVPAAEHWASVLGEDVNRARGIRPPPVA